MNSRCSIEKSLSATQSPFNSSVDLLGHGRSDRPPEMSNYSMTFFARQVEALLDHLELDQAVVGGTSLGANTTLELAYLSPDRVVGGGVAGLRELDAALLRHVRAVDQVVAVALVRARGGGEH